MKLWNGRVVLLLALGMTGLFSGAGLLLGGVPAALWTVGLCLCFDLLLLAAIRSRSRRVARMAEDVDRILQGEKDINLQEYDEGSLAVLQNRVQKLTVQLHQQAEALQADKTGLADSLADISHQIRTPLTSLNLIAASLSRPELSPEGRTEAVLRLRQQLARIDWLIEALLKMSRLEAGTIAFAPETAPLGALVDKAAAGVIIPMELREQRLTVQVPPEAVFQGDLAWTAEALGNVLKNCMEHTPKGGVISVTGVENPICVQLTVQDSGSGFDPADLPHLFQRFYKGKDAGAQSVGIGLALAREILARQNGTIKAENAPEGGARFTLRLYKSTL